MLMLTALPTGIAAGEMGKTIAREGAEGVPACIACHLDRQVEDRASTNPSYPYLVGQPAGYLIKQIKDYKAKKRNNAIMQPVASALSENQVIAVAEYYAKLPLPELAIGNVNSSDNAGEKISMAVNIANYGKWSASVPACFRCHGDKGQGLAPHFPAIAGQPEAYLKTQLSNWRVGERSNDHGGLMQSITAGLTSDEIDVLARYLSKMSSITKK